ncbi:hypothetical protein V6Z11_D12G041000 [Gossypium hirsutum]|uniref:Uncharacterized protein n=1 Tax=Gossypium tomentosum TaxID=34277 RepID=A0A5D2I6F8_GOSTO|nr:hypothetical protein ES332_D12G041900v1 [Gossypium tomentosum]
MAHKKLPTEKITITIQSVPLNHNARFTMITNMHRTEVPLNQAMALEKGTRANKNTKYLVACSDLEGPRDISVWKMASEVPSTTPTAMIAGWSSHCQLERRKTQSQIAIS